MNKEISYRIFPNCCKLAKMIVVNPEENESFAAAGDSGALVTMNKEGHEGHCQEYALGIVSQMKDAQQVENAILCVRLEDCIGALQALDQGLQHSDVEVYKGMLKPNIAICNKRNPHQGDQTILVYRK